MKGRMFSAAAVALIAAMGLVGCGSSSGGTPVKAGTPAGYSKGVIAANSGLAITVNGVSYSTAGSSISIDRTSGTSTDLKVGKIAQVRGSKNDDGVTGSGAEIEFDDNLEGMITAVTGTASVTVFGQTVEVDANTVFSGTSGLSGAAPLTIGDVIEVSGFPTGTGGILATFVEKKTGVTTFEIKGLVSNFTGSNSFTLTPSSSTAPVAVTLGSGVAVPSGFGNGKLVEVWTTDTNAGAAITATRVELEIELEPAEQEGTELEGAISSFTSISSFVVNGVTVNAGTAAVVGGTAADLKLNAKVEVQGTFAGGVLTASRVALKTTW